MTPEDRELLEYAAKAVNGGAWHPLTHDTPNGVWNPLTDDGDALRLAVKLRMMVDDIKRGYMAGHIVAVVERTNMNDRHAEYEPREPDPYAAARRAIVRAAAELGRKK